MMTVEEAVSHTLQQYNDACNTGDVEAYMATLTEDVVFNPIGQPPVHGRESVGVWAQEGFFDLFVVEFNGTLDRIVVVGSEAFAPGRFTLDLAPKDGGAPINLTGQNFNIFREIQPGSWKYSYAIFNFDQPFG